MVTCSNSLATALFSSTVWKFNYSWSWDL